MVVKVRYGAWIHTVQLRDHLLIHVIYCKFQLQVSEKIVVLALVFWQDGKKLVVW